MLQLSQRRWPARQRQAFGLSLLGWRKWGRRGVACGTGVPRSDLLTFHHIIYDNYDGGWNLGGGNDS